MKLSELVTNEKRKVELQIKARIDANNADFNLPHPDSLTPIFGTYHRQAVLEAENQVYIEAFNLRKLRLDRMVQK